MDSWTHCLLGCIFSCSRGNCKLFFQFPFSIYWNSINFAYALHLGNNYIFTSQRESHSLPYMVFFANLQLFVPFGVIEKRITKIIFKYFNENCDYSSCPGWCILCLYSSPRKAWKGPEIIFELVFLFHIVLKSLVSY